MSTPQYFVNDKTRMCSVRSGPGAAEEAAKDGFRKVSMSDQEAFRAVTRVAIDAGWKPDSISYAKFMAKHPELVDRAHRSLE